MLLRKIGFVSANLKQVPPETQLLPGPLVWQIRFLTLAAWKRYTSVLLCSSSHGCTASLYLADEYWELEGGWFEVFKSAKTC